ncbi:hypothetical protein C7C46_25855 [Streptomyces tateyamensis]|uniref:Glycosyltransferase family 2 protein n=1 Tax=Streptomyces tateyamensis TaxID=565073 RepID=A0A2V4MZS7_9ACTN|nr:DUF6271 family protein [Streptomyces tateyamensis]PYC72072.1 hypothetical protein C7C46_25855 [Streptomyces tateyamensis]
MRRICLTLPTNRECAGTIAAIGAEAAWAAAHFEVEVHLLVLDSADPAERAGHAAALAELPPDERVVVHHLDEDAQRAFLAAAIGRAALAKPEQLLELMLPAGCSYGACTNRAFLIAAALGCSSVHRRDSDSRYQEAAGEPVYPIRHELAGLGRPAAEAAAEVTETSLDPALADRPVSLVGATFIGELSVDLGEIEELDPQVYHEVVSLWAPAEWGPQDIDLLVAESFRGAGTEPFEADHSVLDLPDMWRLDMCNISFDHELYHRVPLPPAKDTIGSDYFLLHVVHDAGLPGVVHNRHIVNYYTGERRTDEGFLVYQERYAKFVLSMLYLHHIYGRLTELGSALLDDRHHVRPELLAEVIRESLPLDRTPSLERMDRLAAAYRRLGGRYAQFADRLAALTPRLVDEAQADTADFALLTEAWGPLVAAAQQLGLPDAP